MRICQVCKKRFTDPQNKNRLRCGSCNTRIRRYRAKAAAIKYLGGKCAHCGWHGNQAALQFHHKNPREKDFIFGNVGNKSWDSLRKELGKCELLCANCHIIFHSKKEDKRFISLARKYKGRKLDF